MGSTPLIGVLALQGGVAEHVRMLEHAGARTRLVRRHAHLEGIDGIIFPGGESTTMSKLMDLGGMLSPLRALLAQGLPAFGTCAGLILLADEVLDTRRDAHSLNGLDVTVRRNAFGRQVDSFETDLAIDALGPDPVHTVFIRAPWVESVGPSVEILASVTASDGREHVVAVRQGNALATAFHPEMTDDVRLHRHFVDVVATATS